MQSNSSAFWSSDNGRNGEFHVQGSLKVAPGSRRQKVYKMPLDDFETRQTGPQRRSASHSACCNLKRRVSWFKSRILRPLHNFQECSILQTKRACFSLCTFEIRVASSEKAPAAAFLCLLLCFIQKRRKSPLFSTSCSVDTISAGGNVIVWSMQKCTACSE